MSRASRTPGAILRAALTPYLHFDDPWVVDVGLATVVANELEGDPLWLLLTNPSSAAKTEMVQAFSAVPTCEWLSQISENTFLSGLQRPTKAGAKNERRNSLLFRLTDPALRGGRPAVRVLLVQDLTGLITVRRERRDMIFSQLREIYDGRLVKRTGMGDDLQWTGYLGLLGAVTPIVDEVAELNSALGERFILYRPERRDPEAEARVAIDRDQDTEWRSTVAEVAAAMVQVAARRLAAVTVPEAVKHRIVGLARLTAAGRARVRRDGHTKHVQVMPEPEGPARLVRQLMKLLRGLCAVRGVREPGDEELAIVTKVARDTMPKTRALVLRALAGVGEEGAPARGIGGRVGLPLSTATYLLQDLAALDVAEAKRAEEEGGRRAADRWCLTERYRGLIGGAGFFEEVPGAPESRVGPPGCTQVRASFFSPVHSYLTDRELAQPTEVGEALGRGAGAPSASRGPVDDGQGFAPCAVCRRVVPKAEFPAHVAGHAPLGHGTRR